MRLEHLFIEGFNTAIYGYGWGTFIISDVMGDDYNGIFISGAGDNMAILDTRFEPFYAINSPNAHVGAQAHLTGIQQDSARLHFAPDSLKNVQVGDYAANLSGPHAGAISQGTKVILVDPKSSEVELSQVPTASLDPDDIISFGGSWARPGVSFYFQGNAGNTTGWYCQRCFSFMYQHGAVIDGTGIGTMSDADFEYQNAFDPETDGSGTFGIRVAGGSAGVSITQSSMGGQAIPFINDMAPPHVLQLANVGFGYPDFIITAGSPGSKATAGAWFSGRTGESEIVTLAGSAAAGTEQMLSVNGQSFSYTTQRGGPAGRILSAWGRAFNSDPILAAQHVVAYRSGDSLSIFAPPSVTLTVAPRVSGSVTASLRKGQSSPGSWGSVNGFTYNGPARFPAVVVGPHDDLSLAFSNFPGDNNGNLPTGAFAIDTSDTKMQFLTWPAGQASSNTLSRAAGDPRWPGAPAPCAARSRRRGRRGLHDDLPHRVSSYSGLHRLQPDRIAAWRLRGNGANTDDPNPSIFGRGGGEERKEKGEGEEREGERRRGGVRGGWQRQPVLFMCSP